MLVDGISIEERGPILVHGYDEPAGGRWIDSVIPGKLATVERTSGETRWISPCEVGYGRGFGAGLGAADEAVVLGPSQTGHRAVRMRLDDGVLLDARDIAPFDEALVHSDLCLAMAPRRVTALNSADLVEIWAYARPGERYHRIARDGGSILVVFTSDTLGTQGVLRLDAETGELLGRLLEPSQRAIHGLAAAAGAAVAVLSEIESAVDPDALAVLSPDGDGGDGQDPTGLALVALRTHGGDDDRPLWFRALEDESEEDFPDVRITADSGKLYLVRGAVLQVHDALSGRRLGEMTLPGLDEQVAFQVSQGAGLLAEETRVSVFEIPD